MGGFNQNPFNTQNFGGGGFTTTPTSSKAVSLSKLAYQAARDLGCIRAGQTLTADILNDIFEAANQMLDGWLIEEFLIIASPPQVFQLQAGLQIYQIGPGQLPPNFDAERPTEIQDANIILNTVNPVLRIPLNCINLDQWANIAIQQLPNTIPTLLYYEKSFDIVTGFSRLLLWGGSITNYQLELYTWDQSNLRQFVDLDTPYLYPPGYPNLIRKCLAVAIAPLMTMYCKSSRADRPMAPSTAMLNMVMTQANAARASVESYNAPQEVLFGDPAWCSRNSRRGGFNYLSGFNGRTGR